GRSVVKIIINEERAIRVAVTISTPVCLRRGGMKVLDMKVAVGSDGWASDGTSGVGSTIEPKQKKFVVAASAIRSGIR
ncbi:MAG: hypothetical protein QOD94_1209, partial [Alphaproteobacteria bacterium]|nr:hypothetical protein [Alphaproteobacteria bacterium]